MAKATFDKTQKEYKFNGKPYFYVKKGDKVIGCKLPDASYYINWIEGTTISFNLTNETYVEIGKLRGTSKGYESAYSSEYTPEIMLEIRANAFKHSDGGKFSELSESFYVGKSSGSPSFSFSMIIDESDFTYAQNLGYEQFEVMHVSNCYFEDDLGYRKNSSYRQQMNINAFNYYIKKGTTQISVRDIWNNGDSSGDNKYQCCYGTIENPNDSSQTITLNFDSMRVEGTDSSGYTLYIAGNSFENISLDYTFNVGTDFWFISDHYE